MSDKSAIPMWPPVGEGNAEITRPPHRRPDFNDENLAARYPQRLRMDPLLGLVKQCSWCEEWWSATLDFFMSQKGTPTGLHPHCKACVNTKRSRRMAPLRETVRR